MKKDQKLQTYLDTGQENNRVSEPAMPYQSRIKVFHSFEAFEAENLAQIAAIPPEENLKNTVDLILRTFGLSRDQLKNRKEKKITIIPRR